MSGAKVSPGLEVKGENILDELKGAARIVNVNSVTGDDNVLMFGLDAQEFINYVYRLLVRTEEPPLVFMEKCKNSAVLYLHDPELRAWFFTVVDL